MKKRGFTLIELLVVVAIIALLISILLPALSAAKEKGNSTKCLSNVRSMGMSVQLYLADWQKMIPFTGNPQDSWTQVLGQQGTSGYGASAALRLCPDAAITNDTNLADQPWWGQAQFAWGNSLETGPDPVTGKPLTSSYGLNGFLYDAIPPDAISTIGGSSARAYTLPIPTADGQVPVFADCIWRHVLPTPTDLPGANLINPGPDSVTIHPISKIMINRHNKAINVSFLDGHGDTVKLHDLYTLLWSQDWQPPNPIPTIPSQ